MQRPLLVEVHSLEEGGYLASCPDIQGCHAEGDTIGAAIDNLYSVARVIYDLCQEKGLPFVSEGTGAAPDQFSWHIEVSPPLKAAA